MAFAHGSNDVANAIGPLAAIYSVIESGGMIGANSALPVWVLLVGGGGIVFGLVTYGHKVIATVGTGITQLTPSRGFAATLAAAATVVIASGTGLPVSTTQVLVGAVLGVGLARGLAALDTRVINKIFLSWLITLPAGAIMSIIFFLILKACNSPLSIFSRTDANTIFCLANNDIPSKIGDTTKVEQLQPSPSIVTIEPSTPASSLA